METPHSGADDTEIGIFDVHAAPERLALVDADAIPVIYPKDQLMKAFHSCSATAIRTHLLTVVSVVALMPTLAADVEFTDGTFDSGDWILIKTGSGVVAASQDLVGGNPGEFVRVLNQPDVNQTVAGWHFNSQFVYDPASDGAIDTVSWSVDFQNLDSGQYVALACVQDGVQYNAAASSVVTTNLGAGWLNHAANGLVGSEFGTPDFSATGSPITFGFLAANSYDPVAGHISYVVGYDNLEIDVASVCGVSASVAFRNAGTNPSSYVAGAAVIDATFTATVDNNLAGQDTSVLFAFDSPVSIGFGGGQTLLCLDLFGSGELFTGGGLTPSGGGGGVDTFSLMIPNDIDSCGFVACSQAIQFGNPPFVLSNAQDLVVGF